jgi:hypothetical protein
VSQPKRGEDGSALVLALFFSVVFFVLLAAMMTFTDVGLKSTKGFRNQLVSGAASAGAVDAAINRYRDGACGDDPAPLTSEVRPVNEKNVIVHCTTTQPANRPANALLARGGSAAEGIQPTIPGVEVRGNVFSNSTVTATSPNTLTAKKGEVSAVDSCSTTGVTTDPVTTLHCPPTGSADPVDGRDPDFAKATDAEPMWRKAECPAAPTWLVKLSPGYYDDPAALSDLTSAGGCAGVSVVWLQPGVYYFDFGFRTGTDGVWNINDSTRTVVAGTPRGWNPDAVSPETVTTPGGCKTESDEPPANGVQIIIGGKSRIEVDNGAKVELCAEPSSAEQQIALYGLSGDKPLHTLEPTVVRDVAGFRDSRNAMVIGETPAAEATVRLASSGPDSGSLTLGGFRPAVPDGAVIESAVLRVAHKDEAGVAPAALSFTGNDACDTGVPLDPSGIVPYVKDLVACGVTTPAQLDGLVVTYTAHAGAAPATDHLDGIWVDVSYRTPTTRRPTATREVSANFAAPDGALEIGEFGDPAATHAVASLNPSATSAAMTLLGFGNPRIPDASTIDSAVLRVAHRDEGAIDTVTANVASASGSCALNVPLHSSALTDERVQLPAGCLDTGADLRDLVVTYSVALESGASSATDTLDGIWLELLYTGPPIVRTPQFAPPSAVFSSPDNAKAIDGALTSDAALVDTGPTAATLVVNNFDSPPVPAGSFIDSAVLRVAHEDTPGAGPATLAVSFPGVGPACSTSIPAHPSSIGVDTFDLRTPGCGFNDPSVLSGLVVSYDVVLPGPGSATHKVDGIALDLAYRPPSRYEAATPDTTGFANADKALVADGATADAALSGAATASVSVDDFATIPVPPGSVIDKAELVVVHEHSGDPGTATASVAFPGSACPPQPVPLHTGTSGEDRVPINTCGFTDPSMLNDLSATYSVDLPAGAATFKLDALVLDVVFRAPTFEPLAGTVKNEPYTGVACGGTPSPTDACALVRTVSTGGTRFVSQGTIYAPSAPLDISMIGVTAPVLTRGLIARTIRLGVSVGGGYTGPTTTVPPVGAELTAYPISDPVIHEPQSHGGGFMATANATSIDGSNFAQAVLSDGGPTTATLSVSNFDQPQVPIGSAIDFAVLRVAHMESGDGGTATVTATAPGGFNCAQPVPARASMTEDRFDLRACGLTRVLGPTGLADLTVNVDVALTPPGTSRTVDVDGVVLELAYRAPETRRASTATTSTSATTQFSSPGNATSIGGPSSMATLDSSGGLANASLTVSDFSQPTIGAGSIDSAFLRVKHQDGPGVIPSIRWAFDGNTCTSAESLSQITGPSDPETVGKNLRDDCGLNDTSQLAGLSVTYDVELDDTTTQTEQLDGIELDVTLLTGPTLRAQVEFDPDSGRLVVKGWSVLH